jgi:hypothetical protein
LLIGRAEFLVLETTPPALKNSALLISFLCRGRLATACRSKCGRPRLPSGEDGLALSSSGRYAGRS